MSSTSKDAVTLRAKRSKKPSDGKMRRNVEIFVLSAIAFQMLVSASSPASVGFDYMLMPRTRARCG